MRKSLWLSLLLLAGAVPAALAQPYQQGPAGGGGGDPFKDTVPGRRQAAVSEVRVWSGGVIDSIQIVYEAGGGTQEGRRHGGGGGNLNTFQLRPGESITAVFGTYGRTVGQIRFETSEGRTSAPYGRGGGSEFRFEAPPGWEVGGFVGRAGGAVDAIGVLLRRAE